MSFSIRLVKKAGQAIAAWAGGTTMQLAIYPEQAEYAKRNFRWRISSARVEAEESEFTRLPGIWRHIMVIEGELVLRHEGHHEALLKPFEQDCFSGDWTTRSRGKVTDFNLMLAEGCKGAIEAVPGDGTVRMALARDGNGETCPGCTEAFYCAAGSVQITVGGERYALQQGDLLQADMEYPYGDLCAVVDGMGKGEAAVIRASIYY